MHSQNRESKYFFRDFENAYIKTILIILNQIKCNSLMLSFTFSFTYLRLKAMSIVNKFVAIPHSFIILFIFEYFMCLGDTGIS
jgi:hypothetical protein